MSSSEIEIECPQCDGWGSTVVKSASGLMTFRTADDHCPACNGTGWRAPTDDELSDMAERQAEDAASGEPPMTVQEMYEKAYELKRELRR